MSQCVPTWDVSGPSHDPELAGSLAQSVFSVSKSKLWDHQQQQFCGGHELPEHVPDHDEVAELTWVNGHPALQGLVSKAPNRHHYRSSGLASYWAGDNHDQASAAAARSAQNEKEVDGTLDAIVLHEAARCDINARAESVANLSTLVDDMVSWFQYPLNDFNQQDAANAAELPRKVINEDIIMRGKCTNSTVRSISDAEHAAAAAAATAGPATTESFDALVPSNIDTDHCNNSIVNHSTNPAGAKGSGAEVEDDGDKQAEEVTARDNTNGSMNFSHFSRPAVSMKANLHVLGAASGPTNIQRVRQYCNYMDEHHTRPPHPRHRQQDAGNVSASDANVPVSIVGSTNGLCTTSFASEEMSRSASLHIARKASRSLPSQVISDDCIKKALDQDRSRNYSMSGSAAEMTSETCDAQDFTFTSTSGGSPNDSTEKSGKETRWKRKSRAEEDWGCQSEDVEDESAQPMKKSQARRSGSTKRSRAAAVHNLSERRRRDRINERMKALQKLIPNSSKTDKASMLDEAIEYLKHLQAQLQMMSFRSGLSIPPVMVPLGMQPLQMSLMASLGQMGLGMGMSGVGLGMGMMDVNSIAAAGCGMVPMQGAGAHALQPATFVQPNLAAFCAAPSDPNDRTQSSAVPDPYTAFLVCQRQATNMDVYNTVALQQQQLHRHQNHCPPPQQQGNASKPS